MVSGMPSSWMLGPLTWTLSEGDAAKPESAVALITVSPGLTGSNATPPAATAVGELYCPPTIVMVCWAAAPLDFTRRPTAGTELVTVTSTLVPGRTGVLMVGGPPAAGSGPAHT